MMLRKKSYMTLTAAALLLAMTPAASAKLKKAEARAETGLVGTANAPLGAHGRVELRLKQKRTTLNVEIEDVAAGSYELMVNGVQQGVIKVDRFQGATLGELEFRNPPRLGALPLTFDPSGANIEVRHQGVAVLSGLAPMVGPTGAPLGTPGAGVGPFPKQRIKARLFGTSMFPPARGGMALVSNRKNATLAMNMRLLPTGNYDVMVGGVRVAAFHSNGRKAKVVFSTKPVITKASKNGRKGANRFSMDFDPAGSTVEVCQGTDVFMKGSLRGTPLGGGLSPAGESEAHFAPTADAPGASGSAKLHTSMSSSSFRVEVEGLPVGTYDMLVDGSPFAMFDVVADAGANPTGRTRSAREDGHHGSGEGDHGNGDNGNGDNGNGDGDHDGDRNGDTDGDNGSSGDNDADGDNDSNDNGNGDTDGDNGSSGDNDADGDNDSNSNGDTDGDNGSSGDNDADGDDDSNSNGDTDGDSGPDASSPLRTHGYVQFSDPVQPGDLLLNFDPSGATIQIVQNGVVVLGLVFP